LRGWTLPSGRSATTHAETPTAARAELPKWHGGMFANGRGRRCGATEPPFTCRTMPPRSPWCGSAVLVVPVKLNGHGTPVSRRDRHGANWHVSNKVMSENHAVDVPLPVGVGARWRDASEEEPHRGECTARHSPAPTPPGKPQIGNVSRAEATEIGMVESVIEPDRTDPELGGVGAGDV